MLTGFICEIDGTSRDAAAGSVEGGVGVGGLKHVPVWQYVQMARQKRIVSIDENMPWMGAGYTREEVIAVADHEAWLVGR